MTRAWILKTEPHVYSFDQLLKDKKTNWDHVRNFQARNFLKQARVGDEALIYHSGDEKRLVGLARVVREAYPDLATADEPKGEWVQIDIEPKGKLARPISLAELKKHPKLKDLLLVRQSRLSVSPIDPSDLVLILQCASNGQKEGQTK